MKGYTDFTWQELGKRIRQRRASRNMSQQALATAARVSQNTIFCLEAGEINPQLSTLKQVAAGLGCSVRDLLCGTTDTSQQLSGRLLRIRALIESGDELAVRILDYGIETAEALLERSNPKRLALPTERKLIVKGPRQRSPLGSLGLSDSIVHPKSETNDMPSIVPDFIQLGRNRTPYRKTKNERE
jgi:transcriptional regulator with XRE-family HTH domain